MRICRYNDNRLGLVQGNEVLDVTPALDVLPAVRWPLPQGDLLIANLDAVSAAVKSLAEDAPALAIGEVKLLSPVANPSKIIGAPSNFKKEVGPEVNFSGKTRPIEEKGLFLKAVSSLVGPSEGCALRFPDHRNDHEVELAVIIGKPGSEIPAEAALDHVAGYSIALDMTVRGPEDASFRKSVDTYSILGPWLVTADEIEDPDHLDLSISVGNEIRQDDNTENMVINVPNLISWASAYYTLLPGDIIMAGTPPGMGPVKPGDTMHCMVEGIGEMDVDVRAS